MGVTVRVPVALPGPMVVVATAAPPAAGSGAVTVATTGIGAVTMATTGIWARTIARTGSLPVRAAGAVSTILRAPGSPSVLLRTPGPSAGFLPVTGSAPRLPHPTGTKVVSVPTAGVSHATVRDARRTTVESAVVAASGEA